MPLNLWECSDVAKLQRVAIVTSLLVVFCTGANSFAGISIEWKRKTKHDLQKFWSDTVSDSDLLSEMLPQSEACGVCGAVTDKEPCPVSDIAQKSARQSFPSREECITCAPADANKTDEIRLRQREPSLSARQPWPEHQNGNVATPSECQGRLWFCTHVGKSYIIESHSATITSTTCALSVKICLTESDFACFCFFLCTAGHPCGWSHLFHSSRSLGVQDYEGQRVLQVCRNGRVVSFRFRRHHMK